jgi:hypothetical protein
MARKIKAALLLCLMSAAGLSGNAAWQSIRRGQLPAQLPSELTVRFAGREDAAWVLRESGGHVAVFEGRKAKEPAAVTPIEITSLRAADRQLLRDGIPAADTAELLALLEDLGS